MLGCRKQAIEAPVGLSGSVSGIGAHIDKLVLIIQNPNSSISEKITASGVIRSYIDLQSLSSITEIWYSVNNLLDMDNNVEVRRSGWKLTKSCISKDEVNNSSFTAYYNSIVRHSNVEDFDMVIQCLDLLTSSGRYVVGSQAPRQLPSVLLNWIQMLSIRTQLLRTQQSVDISLQWGTSTEDNFNSLMLYTISVLKFRMSIWEPQEIEKLLLVVVAIVRQTSQISDCEWCCQILLTVMAYGLVPSTVLQPVLEVLCGMAYMVPNLKQQCNECIKGLSKSHLQNSTFVRLCRILDSPNREITLSMRTEAASQLHDLASDSQNVESLVQNMQNSPNVGDNLLGESLQMPLELELPMVEVLECYYRTIKVPETPLSLIVTILNCFSNLLLNVGLLNRITTTAFVYTDSDGDSLITPLDIVAEFSKIYTKLSESDKTLVVVFRQKMEELATFLSSMLLDKSLNINSNEHILLCIRVSFFMNTESCKKLLDAIEFLQFCTPGLPSWFYHLEQILEHIYIPRLDDCRKNVVKLVENAFSVSVHITSEQMLSIVNVLFSNIETSSPETILELLSLYEKQLFFSETPIFQTATALLAKSCIRDGSILVMDTLLKSFATAFKLHPKQSLTLLHEFTTICLQTKSKPEIFGRSWSVLSRIRTNRWDNLVLVDHRIENSYGDDLISFQQALPRQLYDITSEPSLVLKSRNSETILTEWPYLYDTTPIIQIIADVLISSDISEHCLILVLINCVPVLAHLRILQSIKKDDNGENLLILPLLRVIRDTLTSFVSSGGAKLPCVDAPPSRKMGCICVAVHILTIMLPCSDLYAKPDCDKLILTLVQAMNQFNLSTGWATHCFTVACYEAPTSLQKYLPQILSRLQLKITNRNSSMYILDFMMTLSQGALTNNFNEHDFKRLFGMCFSFIQDTNYQLMFSTRGGIAANWLLRLAYTSICQLFLSMPLENRRSLVPYLLRNLILANNNTKTMDHNCLVIYDMITRFTYSDLPLRAHMDTIPKLDPRWEVRRWLWNFTLLELRCNKHTGEGIKIIRKPAGIFTISLNPSVSSYNNTYEPTFPTAPNNSTEISAGDNYTANFFLLGTQIGLGSLQFEANINSKIKKFSLNELSESELSEQSTQPQSPQLLTTENEEDGPSLGTSMPLLLPDDAATNRAISAIDRVPIVDFYKIGIIYCAPGQRLESEILSNQSGSDAYRNFVQNIGVLIKLKHNRQYYVGGLDTEQDLDGEYAIAWSSKISQIIFHTTTMMPSFEGDTSYASKKRHIGNNFVNIYFDESGEDFEFDVVKSQFNFINIVITPTYNIGIKRYWKVRVYQKPGMQNTSAAYELKVVTENSLALFVRNLALKLSLYASIHNSGGNHTDNWVYRLQLLSTLKERVLKQMDEQKALQSDVENNDNDDDDLLHFISEDDFQIGNTDIELLRWVDFTQYTA